MLHIIPIQDKKMQSALCDHFEVAYDPRSFAYIAEDCSESGEIISHIGFMQFSVNDTFSEVSAFVCEKGTYDIEAMQIMARAAFSFVHRLSVFSVRIPKSAVKKEIAEALRLDESEDFWSIDVKHYYESRCGER